MVNPLSLVNHQRSQRSPCRTQPNQSPNPKKTVVVVYILSHPLSEPALSPTFSEESLSNQPKRTVSVGRSVVVVGGGLASAQPAEHTRESVNTMRTQSADQVRSDDDIMMTHGGAR